MSLILAPSDTDFEITGPPEWSPDGWDLDRLVVPYRGPYTQLDAFLASHPMWEASAIDGEMFLADYSSDDHKQFPTVRLVYKGKRDGVLPPDRNTTDVINGEVRFTSFTGKTWINLTYQSPTSTIRTWSRSPIDLGGITPPQPADVIGVFATAHTEEGRTLPVTIEQAITFFAQEISRTGNGQEEIPGEYYSATVTEQALLFSIEF